MHTNMYTHMHQEFISPAKRAEECGYASTNIEIEICVGGVGQAKYVWRYHDIIG